VQNGKLWNGQEPVGSELLRALNTAYFKVQLRQFARRNQGNRVRVGCFLRSKAQSNSRARHTWCPNMWSTEKCNSYLCNYRPRHATLSTCWVLCCFSSFRTHKDNAYWWDKRLWYGE